ncbi:MAG TPA: SET domain-containing protein-lysine N-methyltransferase [Chryseosolibacter sp.]
MALLEKQLFVKKSTIPNSGKGLFTKKFIPKGTRIVEYKGKISKWKDVKDEDGKNGYIFFVNRNHVINALPTKWALARYANDARGLSKIKGLTNNCDYISEGTKAYIESKKDIPAGSEIFVDYGKDYWKVIRENMKLWAREKKEAEKKAAKAKKTVATTKKGKTVRSVQPANGKKLNGTYHVNSRKALTRNRVGNRKKVAAK